MPADAHGLVEIVVGDADVVAPDALGDVQVSRVCRGQVRFCVLAPEEVYGLDVAVLLRQVREVPFERRLRRLGARNLDTLAKRLQPLLLPKHWAASSVSTYMRFLSIRLTWDTSAYLSVAEAVVLRN